MGSRGKEAMEVISNGLRGRTLTLPGIIWKEKLWQPSKIDSQVRLVSSFPRQVNQGRRRVWGVWDIGLPPKIYIIHLLSIFEILDPFLGKLIQLSSFECHLQIRLQKELDYGTSPLALLYWIDNYVYRYI